MLTKKHLQWFCKLILNKALRNIIKEVIKAADNDMHNLKKDRIMLYFLCSDFKVTGMWIKKKVNDIQKNVTQRHSWKFSGIS